MKKLIFGAIALIPFLFSAQQKFSIIPSVGYAWRVAKTADGLSQEEKDYVNELKSGAHFDVGVYYNIRQNWGLGLKYSSFGSSSKVVVADFDALMSFYTEDKINFFGPAFMYSNFNLETKHKLYYDIGLGVISYTSTTNGVKAKGSNLGLDANLAYQYAVSKMFYIGPKLGYTVGTLTKMKVNGSTYDLGDNKEGLGRISLALAGTLRF